MPKKAFLFALDRSTPSQKLNSMKAWKDQTPINKHVALMKVTRERLWQELVEHPEYTEPKVKKLSGYIDQLNKKIAKRVLTAEEVEKLVSDVRVYSRNYKRIAAKKRKAKRPKMSVGSIKFVLKKVKHDNKNKSIKKANQAVEQTNLVG